MMKTPIGVIVAVIAVMAAGGFYLWQLMPTGETLEPPSAEAETAMAGLPEDFVMPPLTGMLVEGAEDYAENCATCHGKAATGSDNGPPLVHKIYEPGHHGDAAFYLAARQGARQHHWSFGDMPPVAGITDQEVERIVAYVRALQEANGIF